MCDQTATNVFSRKVALPDGSAETIREAGMIAQQIQFRSVADARAAIDGIGSGNSEIMATRAVHVNVLVRGVAGPEARFLKTVYNDVGAEAAISHEAYFQEPGAQTDMIVMGSIYQHREVRRILRGNPTFVRLIDAIISVVEDTQETSP
jgi:hypothetical protein